MTENSPPKLGTWWTPTGYERRPRPAVYEAIFADNEGSTDLHEDFRKAGYVDIARTEEHRVSYDMELQIWSRNATATEPAHMFVDMWNASSSLGTVWVSDEHVDAWWFTEFPRLLACQRQTEAAVAQVTLTKAVIAFIRHGHGFGTISEYGDRDADDIRRDAEVKRWAEKQKQQKPPPT